MSSALTGKLNFSSKKRRNTPQKNVKYFTSNKRRLHRNSFENKPLLNADQDSCSDEEITLHDIRHLKRHSVVNETSNLRKLKKKDSLHRNGAVSQSTKPSDPFQHCEFLDLKIQEGDTLQSISIKYQCSISDIKRANNLISSQEFYALKQLKIPVKRYSLLTEILPAVQDHNSNSTIVEDTDNVRTINIGIGSSGRSPSPQDAAAFFKRMDEDLVKIMLSTNSQKDSLEAAAVALTTPQIQPLVKDPYNTVDCGIQWNYLIIFIIVIAIVIPAAVALYIYVRSSQEHPDSVYPGDSSNPPSIKEKR